MNSDLSDNNTEDDVEVEIKSHENIKQENPNEETEKTKLENSEIKIDEEDIENLKNQISTEKEKLSTCEDKLKRIFADFQNLERKTELDIEKGVNTKIDKFMLNFLQIYDDFVRAKDTLADEKINVVGLNAILKNMNNLLSAYGVTPIDALGEIFDPNLHETISIIEDGSLDENTITKEIRKGYISHNKVVRPSLVEISKKSKMESLEGKQNG